MSNQQLQTVPTQAMTIEQAIDRHNTIVEFVKKVMNEGVDYGVIPGTDKPTLLKPGAEKLCTLFNLSTKFVMTEKIMQWGDGGQEPLFMFGYKCRLTNGSYSAEGEGSCNSREKKYRWRNADRVCPNCGKTTIIKGKQEYGGGWICFLKKGGCGAKFADNDPAITGQATGQVQNPDIADQVNTLQKMAQKRALIAATLIAVNASEFFTQDIEDMQIIEGEYTDKKPEKPSGESKQETASSGATSNTDKPIKMSENEKWPTARPEFDQWLKDHKINGALIHNAIGSGVDEWMKINKSNYLTLAQTIAAQLGLNQ